MLNNLALSVMLAGAPERAEPLLRRAADDEISGPGFHQNPVLSFALHRRFDEAERITLVDSTPEMARQNLNSVRALSSSGRSYDRLR